MVELVSICGSEFYFVAHLTGDDKRAGEGSLAKRDGEKCDLLRRFDHACDHW
jgi:hypothetical protein